MQQGPRQGTPRTCECRDAPVQAVQVLLREADRREQVRVQADEQVRIVAARAREQVEAARDPVRQVQHDNEVARDRDGQEADGEVVLQVAEEPPHAVQAHLRYNIIA